MNALLLAFLSLVAGNVGPATGSPQVGGRAGGQDLGAPGGSRQRIVVNDPRSRPLKLGWVRDLIFLDVRYDAQKPLNGSLDLFLFEPPGRRRFRAAAPLFGDRIPTLLAVESDEALLYETLPPFSESTLVYRIRFGARYPNQWYRVQRVGDMLPLHVQQLLHAELDIPAEERLVRIRDGDGGLRAAVRVSGLPPIGLESVAVASGSMGMAALLHDGSGDRYGGFWAFHVKPGGGRSIDAVRLGAAIARTMHLGGDRHAFAVPSACLDPSGSGGAAFWIRGRTDNEEDGELLALCQHLPDGSEGVLHSYAVADGKVWYLDANGIRQPSGIPLFADGKSLDMSPLVATAKGMASTVGICGDEILSYTAPLPR